jgi:LmbE family N-acetylglucosaminyl deacetylase
MGETAVNRLLDNARGVVAPLMAVVAVPVMTAVGMAVDYTRINAARTTFQVALDATAPMMSKKAATKTDASSNTSYHKKQLRFAWQNLNAGRRPQHVKWLRNRPRPELRNQERRTGVGRYALSDGTIFFLLGSAVTNAKLNEKSMP